MWESYGDGFDIVKHDEERHPRKIKHTDTISFVVFLTSILAPWCIVYFADAYKWCAYNIEIITWLGVGFIGVFAILVLLKYIFNKNELDRSLLVYIAVVSLNTVIFSMINF